MELLNKITQIFFPDLCIGCDNRLLHEETNMCIKCELSLVGNQFDYKSRYLKELFLPHFPITEAYSLFFFNKNTPLQNIIHGLKYKGLSKNGVWLGQQLKNQSHIKSLLQTVDYILPIPIHHQRLKKRGYNQSEIISKVICFDKTILHKDSFIRVKFKKSQTSKSRIQRMDNLKDSFQFIGDISKFEGKHVLIVDDVITTGSTVISFINLLQQTFTQIQISIVSVAVTLP